MSSWTSGWVGSPAASSTAMMPSSEALCASAGPATRSPIAYTPGAVVRCAPSTRTRPRSSSPTPAAARPSPSTSGAAARGDHQVLDLSGDGRRPRAGDRADARRLADLHVGDRGARVDAHAVAAQAALDQARDVGVLGGEHAVEHLEQQHLAAQAHERRGDLRARRPRPHDGQPRRHLGQRPRLLGAEHAPAELHAGDRAPRRAGGEHHGRGLVLLLAHPDPWTGVAPPAVGARHAVAGRHERGLAREHLDPVFLEEAPHAAGQRADDPVPARLHRGVVHLDARDADPELVGLPDLARAGRRSAAPPWRGYTRSSGTGPPSRSRSTTAVRRPSCAARIAAT